MGEETNRNIVHGGVDMNTVMRSRFEKVLQKLKESPNNVDLLIQAGSALEGLGMKDQAQAYYLRALQLDPSQTFLRAKVAGAVPAPAAAPAPAPAAASPPPPAAAPPAPTAPALAPAPPEAVPGPGGFTQPNPFLRVLSKPTRSYFEDLMLSWAYPVRSPGLFVLLGGSVMLAIARMVFGGSNALGIIGFGFGLFTLVSTVAYLAVYYMKIISESSYGRDEVPTWPDFEPAMFEDACRWYSALAASYFPAILCLILAVQQGPPLGIVFVFASIPAALLGVVYYPMAMLSNSISGSNWTAWNPAHGFGSIVKVLSHYVQLLIVAGVLVVAFTIAEGGAWLVEGLVHIGAENVHPAAYFLLAPVRLVGAFLQIYMMMVMSRMVGLLYYHTREKLGWYSV